MPSGGDAVPKPRADDRVVPAGKLGQKRRLVDLVRLVTDEDEIDRNPLGQICRTTRVKVRETGGRCRCRTRR